MPKIKFSAKKIQALKPMDKGIEYVDDSRKRGQGRFGLRVSPAGLKTWFIQYKSPVDKKIKRFTLGTFPELSLADARKKADSSMTEINAGEDPMKAKADYHKAETFDDLWKAYCRHPDTKKGVASTIKENQRKYDKLLKPVLGDMRVVDIRRKHLNLILDDMAERTPVSANRLYSLLSVIFNRIALDKEWINSNPMPSKKPLSKEKERDRELINSEIEEVWKHLDTMFGNPPDIFKIILLTGQRPGEVSGMTWAEIDMDEALWTLPKERTKSKKYKHLVPLSDQAMKIISARQDNGSSFVFPSNHGSKVGYTKHLHKARLKVIKDLKMEQWGAHDLRRTASTIMNRLVDNEDLIERVLGHAVGKMRKTYNRYAYLKEKRKALDKLGREVDRITGAEVVPSNVIQLMRQG